MNKDELITKQAALNTVEFMYEACDTFDIKDYHDLMVEAINVLPSAPPERKTGKWIVYYECPKCGEITKDFMEYCPFCGADMREGDKVC